MDLRTLENRLNEEYSASFQCLNGNPGFSFVIIPEFLDSNRATEIQPILDIIPEIMNNESFVQLNKADIYDILVEMKVFKSKSDARKNWKKSDSIEDGLSTFLVGGKKIPLFIYKLPEIYH